MKFFLLIKYIKLSLLNWGTLTIYFFDICCLKFNFESDVFFHKNSDLQIDIQL